MSLRSLGLLFVRSLMLRILLCIPQCFHILHDGTMNFSSSLDTAPWHHSSWTDLPFLLGGWKVLHQWCHCTRHIILKCRHLLFGTSLHTYLLVGDYVCHMTSSGCKCLFIVYAFFSWEASCYESCLVSHDVSIYCMMELRTFLHVSILHL